jgi:hypothetical protein
MSRRTDRREARIEREEYGAPPSSGVKQLIVLLAVAFVITLGVVVGTRMSSDAIAVLVGVIAGVAASIPCALLLLVVTRRRQTAESEPTSAAPGSRWDAVPNKTPYERPSVPPVIVVTPGSSVPQQIAPWSTTSGLVDGTAFDPYGQAQPQGQRQFRVMGYEEAETQADWEG